MSSEWQQLRDEVNTAADKCIAIDPENADVYRAEARQFCEILPPSDPSEMGTLKVEAALLLVRWVRRRPQHATLFEASAG